MREEQMFHRPRFAAVDVAEADRLPAVRLLDLAARQIRKQRHAENPDTDFIRTERLRRSLLGACSGSVTI